MRLSRNANFWLAIALCAGLYAIFWKIKLPSRGTVLYLLGNLAMIWLITLAFLFVQLHWNGPRRLRHCTDEIRVLPNYRNLIANALYPDEQFGILKFFLFFSAGCILFISPFCLFHFFVWGSAAYHALIGIDILLHLDLIPRGRATAWRLFWVSIAFWVPMPLLAADKIFNLLNNHYASSLHYWAALIYGAMIIATIGLPLYYGLKLYNRALGELDKLRYTEPFWPRRDEI